MKIDLFSNQELNHQFNSEPKCLSIHPTAIFICITFAEVVDLYVYTIDGLTLFKQFSIHNSRCVWKDNLILFNYLSF
jgi:hypothetical protein